MPRKKSKKTTLQNNSSVTKWVTNPLSLVLIITFSGLILAGKLWGDYRNHLRSIESFRVDQTQLTLNEPPTWLNRQSLQDCSNRFLWEDRYLLDTDLTKDIAEHLSKQSWIKSVEQVRKSSSGIQATVTYRVPVAVVEIGDSLLLPVDGTGCVLDGGDVTKNQIQNYFRIAIAGVHHKKLPAGSIWPDRRVVDASRLAELTLPLKSSLQIDGIYGDKPSDNRPPEFRFWTAERDEFIWGSPIGLETGSEAKAEVKLSILKQLTPERRKKFPGYRSSGGNVFDLRMGRLRSAMSTTDQPQVKRF